MRAYTVTSSHLGDYMLQGSCNSSFSTNHDEECRSYFTQQRLRRTRSVAEQESVRARARTRARTTRRTRTRTKTTTCAAICAPGQDPSESEDCLEARFLQREELYGSGDRKETGKETKMSRRNAFCPRNLLKLRRGITCTMSRRVSPTSLQTRLYKSPTSTRFLRLSAEHSTQHLVLESYTRQ